MIWSDDIEQSNKKMQPKLGRRAGNSNSINSGRQQPEDPDDFGSTDDILDNFREEEIMQAPIPIAKKTGGWADETLKSAKGKPSTNIIEQERFQDQKLSFDDDIPVIPDIDEIQDDFQTEVVQAPSVTINRVSTYRELDKDLLKQNAYSQFGEINLSHLTRFMYLDKDISDPNIVWTKDSLFNELITEYRGTLNEIV